MTDDSEPDNAGPLDGPHVRCDDDLLELLAGDWKITRTMGKEIAHSRMCAEWELNHQFLQLHMIDENEPPEYEAIVSIGYEYEISRYVIYWLDTFGGRYSLNGYGARAGNSILFVFESRDGLLHNRFSYDAKSNSWHSRIDQRAHDGPWKLFLEDDFVRV